MVFGFLTLGLVLAGCPKKFSYHPQDPSKDNEGFMSPTSTPTITPTITPVPKRIFVTNDKFNGGATGINGLAGADNICTTKAFAANLGGSGAWIAWISAGAANAIDRIVEMGPWVLVGEVPDKVIFANKAALTTGPAALINRSELGLTIPLGDLKVWTGTFGTGIDSAINCSNWSMTSVSGTAGNAANTSVLWTDDGNFPCTETKRIYCIEQ